MAARFLATLSLLIVMAIALTTAIGSLQGGGHMSEIAALNMVLVIGGGPLAVILLMLAVIAAISKRPRPDEASPTASRRPPDKVTLAGFSFGFFVCGAWYFLGYKTPTSLVVSGFLVVYGTVVYGVFKATVRPRGMERHQ